MKTSTWQPSSSHQGDSISKLGLAQRFIVTGRGHKSMELSAVAALCMTINYIRASVEVSVTTMEGVEVAHNRSQLNGEEDCLQALFLLDQALISEHSLAVRQTLDAVAERAGLGFTEDGLVEVEDTQERHAQADEQPAHRDNGRSSNTRKNNGQQAQGDTDGDDRPASAPALRPRQRNRRD